jgi:hypothetical protein
MGEWDALVFHGREHRRSLQLPKILMQPVFEMVAKKNRLIALRRQIAA